MEKIPQNLKDKKQPEGKSWHAKVFSDIVKRKEESLDPIVYNTIMVLCNNKNNRSVSAKEIVVALDKALAERPLTTQQAVDQFNKVFGPVLPNPDDAV